MPRDLDRNSEDVAGDPNVVAVTIENQGSGNDVTLDSDSSKPGANE